MKMFRIQRESSERRGVAAVEMAFVFPVFMLLVLGVIEFGRYMMVGQLVTNAAREGSRLAIRGTFTEEEVKQDILAFITDAVGVTAGQVVIDVSTESGDTIQSAESKDPITVSVAIRFKDVTYLPFLDEGGSGDDDPFSGLRAQHDADDWITGVSVMRKE
ncbi:TadE/TadG family type IV pilus assembly protein [Symmachiella dynata]|uniref:TadE/TadG family type IV pilus assembly protein n=1 Tax=Symmachiella dynata TaxID=2527995 RepID=UPI0030EC0B3C|tara:strand:- start:318 stop:797 length:480 start_codon:yes stop_codon:yes gene_type:complete